MLRPVSEVRAYLLPLRNVPKEYPVAGLKRSFSESAVDALGEITPLRQRTSSDPIESTTPQPLSCEPSPSHQHLTHELLREREENKILREERLAYKTSGFSGLSVALSISEKSTGLSEKEIEDDAHSFVSSASSSVEGLLQNTQTQSGLDRLSDKHPQKTELTPLSELRELNEMNLLSVTRNQEYTNTKVPLEWNKAKEKFEGNQRVKRILDQLKPTIAVVPVYSEPHHVNEEVLQEIKNYLKHLDDQFELYGKKKELDFKKSKFCSLGEMVTSIFEDLGLRKTISGYIFVFYALDDTADTTESTEARLETIKKVEEELVKLFSTGDKQDNLTDDREQAITKAMKKVIKDFSGIEPNQFVYKGHCKISLYHYLSGVISELEEEMKLACTSDDSIRIIANTACQALISLHRREYTGGIAHAIDMMVQLAYGEDYLQKLMEFSEYEKLRQCVSQLGAHLNDLISADREIVQAIEKALKNTLESQELTLQHIRPYVSGNPLLAKFCETGDIEQSVAYIQGKIDENQTLCEWMIRKLNEMGACQNGVLVCEAWLKKLPEWMGLIKKPSTSTTDRYT
jgi:hypothetical protein